jgi:arginyl-tRNA synthetase
MLVRHLRVIGTEIICAVHRNDMGSSFSNTQWKVKSLKRK